MSTERSAGFAPIAIVARACVLPGAMSPEQLWDAVLDRRDLLSNADKQRWRLPADLALTAPGRADPDRAVHDRVGAVDGFDACWNPEGFKVPATSLGTLDPLVHWLLHVGRDCLAATQGDLRRTGAVIGNLGFPSESMARCAEQVWRGEAVTDSRNRFMSGGTAQVFSEALGLGLGASCLDAACASSLYALSVSCAALHDGRADLMLAGAVQRADDLFLHVGFSALTALSRSGQSRPFHRDADGLVPAEGAVLFALKRLADARRDGDTIHGVIRGIGLSNDGRGRGLLVPDQSGQERSLRLAWSQSGMDPTQLGLLECHATGTTVGDATEIASSATVFAHHPGLPIGSLKSNLGHLITAAGGAGLLKVLAAMKHGIRPPTRLAGDENPALSGTPFRILTAAEPWPTQGPRIAAVSAFGFGGNNAHLIVSEDDPSLDLGTGTIPAPQPIAVVGLGLRHGALAGRIDAESQLLSGKAPESGRMEHITIDLEGLRTPPRDLARCLPQQVVLFETTAEALRHVTIGDAQRCSVLVGMEPDPDVARYGLRWRLANELSGEALNVARDGVVPALDASAVLGAMPNIPANRLSSQYDFGGPSFTVQALRDSGLVALDLAIGQLQRGEMDTCVVSAVDFASNPAALWNDPTQKADAAITLVLKPWANAVKAGEPILARLETLSSETPRAPEFSACAWDKPGAASGLLDLVLAMLRQNRDLDADGAPELASPPAFDVTLPSAAPFVVRPHPGRIGNSPPGCRNCLSTRARTAPKCWKPSPRAAPGVPA
ncbi:MAG: hypothetical protein IPK97_15945 [Ahniella sp.]|nr:hypothetical protein [Ahniella sp.]